MQLESLLTAVFCSTPAALLGSVEDKRATGAGDLPGLRTTCDGFIARVDDRPVATVPVLL